MDLIHVECRVEFNEDEFYYLDSDNTIIIKKFREIQDEFNKKYLAINSNLKDEIYLHKSLDSEFVGKFCERYRNILSDSNNSDVIDSITAKNNLLGFDETKLDEMLNFISESGKTVSSRQTMATTIHHVMASARNLGTGNLFTYHAMDDDFKRYIVWDGRSVIRDLLSSSTVSQFNEKLEEINVCTLQRAKEEGVNDFVKLKNYGHIYLYDSEDKATFTNYYGHLNRLISFLVDSKEYLIGILSGVREEEAHVFAIKDGKIIKQYHPIYTSVKQEIEGINICDFTGRNWGTYSSIFSVNKVNKKLIWYK